MSIGISNINTLLAELYSKADVVEMLFELVLQHRPFSEGKGNEG